MIGDRDTGRQPAVALREPMAQRGERKSMWEAWLCGSVFRRDPCLIEDGVRGESPSYRNHLFVGAAFAATIAPSSIDRATREGSLRPSPIIRRHEPTAFCRGGFHRDHRVIEDRGSFPLRCSESGFQQPQAVAPLEPMAQWEGEVHADLDSYKPERRGLDPYRPADPSGGGASGWGRTWVWAHSSTSVTSAA